MNLVFNISIYNMLHSTVFNSLLYSFLDVLDTLNTLLDTVNLISHAESIPNLAAPPNHRKHQNSFSLQMEKWTKADVLCVNMRSASGNTAKRWWEVSAWVRRYSVIVGKSGQSSHADRCWLQRQRENWNEWAGTHTCMHTRFKADKWW